MVEYLVELGVLEPEVAGVLRNLIAVLIEGCGVAPFGDRLIEAVALLSEVLLLRLLLLSGFMLALLIDLREEAL